MQYSEKIIEFEKEQIERPRRREISEYCMVVLINGHFPCGTKKWYWMMEGEEFFCRIEWEYRTNRIKYLYPCRLHNSTIFEGRSIDPKDCIII